MIEKIKKTEIENILNLYDSEENKKAIINYFLNDQELFHQLYKINNSFVAVIDNLEIPAWTLSRFNSIIENDDLKEILGGIADIKEKENRNQFFLLVSEDEYPLYSSVLPRYNFYLEHIILPNTVTRYENIDHDVLSYQYYEKKMMVYLCVLKNEYRVI